MAVHCCTSGGPSRPLARRLTAAAGSILPGAALVLLPKCPLCLAAWLAVATGVSIPVALVAPVRGLVIALWVAAMIFAGAQILRRRRAARSPLPR